MYLCDRLTWKSINAAVTTVSGMFFPFLLPFLLRVTRNHINKHRKIVCCLFLARPISINQCNRIKKLIFENRKRASKWMRAVKLFDIFIVIEKVYFSSLYSYLWDFIVMYRKSSGAVSSSSNDEWLMTRWWIGKACMNGSPVNANDSLAVSFNLRERISYLFIKFNPYHIFSMQKE
jgi:hypothetical protein